MNLKRITVEIAILIGISLIIGLIQKSVFMGSMNFESADAKVCPVGPTFEQALESHKNHDAILIDARPKSEFIEGHIRGAWNLPFDEFLNLYDTTILSFRNISGAAPIIVYCGGPVVTTAQQLADQLRNEGYTNVQIYTGGFTEWHHRGAPISDGEF